MNKPSNYESTQAAGEFTPLKLGGHVCRIMQVEEMISKTGLSMLKISLDIAEGEQANYFADQYKADTRTDKKWGCVVYSVVDESTDYGTKNLKTFVTCVQNSNQGFQPVWGEKFALSFKGKLIGGVFGREQYLNTNAELKWSTKCVQFRSVISIRVGVEIPQDKLLNGSRVEHNSANANTNPVPGQDGFMDIPDGMSEELPFM